jgi:uncharacterized membrane protein YheB (UPF0754 family)
MKTYDIKSEFYAILELLENEEFDQETGELIDNSEAIQQLLNEIEAERDTKANNIAYLIKEAKDTENALKAEIDRLNQRKKMFIREQESLKQLLDFLLNGEKLKTDKFTFSYRNSLSVKILDKDLIPAEYLNVKEVFTPDKNKIKEALPNFENVTGAEIEVKKSLIVK